MDREDIIVVMLAQQWEKCKGELKALVAISGSCVSTSSRDSWEMLEIEINKFIANIEDNALQE